MSLAQTLRKWGRPVGRYPLVQLVCEYVEYGNMVVGPRNEKNQEAVSVCEQDLAIGGCDEQTCGWSIGSCLALFANPF
jgi:hypothetical protein